MTFTTWFPALSGTVFGVAGLVTAAWTTISGHRHERQLAADRELWTQNTERTQWLRDRRADAYIGFLNLAYRTESVVTSALNALYENETEPTPYLQDPGEPRESARTVTGDEIRQAHVLVSTYGSPRIRDLVEAWRPAAVAALGGTAWLLQISQADDGTVAAHLPRLAELRAEIGELISAELHGERER